MRLNPIPGLSIRPYSVLKLTEQPASQEYPDLQKEYRRYIQRCWTRARVTDMATEQIEAQLRSFGVDHSTDRFLDLSRGLNSAWDLSEKWFAIDSVTCSGMDEDFLGLAACELWKRLPLQRPSLEMIDDWMEEGYRFEYTDEVAACENWWKAWSALYPLLKPTMGTMESISTVYSGTYILFNWCQSFEGALNNASLQDPKFVEIGRRYCVEWLGQFTQEDVNIKVAFTRTLAEFTCKLGQVDEARELLEKALENWPEDPWVYVALSDAWSHLFADQTHHLPFDIDKAREYLQLGLSRLKGKEDRRILQERLTDLRAAVPVSEKHKAKLGLK